MYVQSSSAGSLIRAQRESDCSPAGRAWAVLIAALPWKRQPRLTSDAGDQVRHPRLMLQHHQRDDVAMGDEVRFRCRNGLRSVTFVPWFPVRLGIVPVLDENVAHVALDPCVPVTYHPPQRSLSGLR